MIHTIEVDKREKRPFEFKSPIELVTLYVGDYKIKGIDHGVVERKGIQDIVNCCFKGLVGSKESTFKSQLLRLEQVKESILVIEGTPKMFLKYARQLNLKTKPETLLHWLYSRMSEYKTVTYWGDSREDAQNFTEWHLLNVAKHHKSML